MRQNKISQRENRDLYNARIFLHKIFHIYLSHMSSQVGLILLSQVKWRSIKVNVRFSLMNSLRYLTFSSVYAVFGRPLPGFRSIAVPHSSTRLQIAFTEQSFQLPTLFRKYCNNCSVSKTKFPQCLDPSFIFVRYFTHNQSHRPNCDYDLKY